LAFPFGFAQIHKCIWAFPFGFAQIHKCLPYICSTTKKLPAKE
jgi:hypothetical protein